MASTVLCKFSSVRSSGRTCVAMANPALAVSLGGKLVGALRSMAIYACSRTPPQEPVGWAGARESAWGKQRTMSSFRVRSSIESRTPPRSFRSSFPTLKAFWKIGEVIPVPAGLLGDESCNFLPVYLWAVWRCMCMWRQCTQ